MTNSNNLSKETNDILFNMYMKKEFPKFTKRFTEEQLMHITCELMDIVDLRKLKEYYNAKK